MGLKVRLFALLVPALAGLLVFGARTCAHQLEMARDLRRAVQAQALLDGTNDLVHELQTERGMSAGFVASRGVRFADQLPLQRRRTDQALVRLRERERNAADTTLVAAVESGIGEAQDLAGRRASIDGLALPSTEVIALYTRHIEKLLAFDEVVEHAETTPELARKVAAASALAHAKEQMGRERATLTVYLQRGTFDLPLYRRVTELVAQQGVYLAAFDGAASPAMRETYRATVSGERADLAEDLRRRALAVGPGERHTVDPTAWFEAATARIVLLRRVEEAQSAESVTHAETERRRAERSAILAIVVALGSAGTALGIGLAMGRRVCAELGAEPSALKSLASSVAAGDLAREVIVPDGDHSSAISSLKVMQTKLREVVGQIRDASHVVEATAGDLSEGSAELAARTERQASTLRGTVAELEELTETVRQTADGTRRATDHALSAASTAREVDTQVSGLAKTMERVTDASAQVSRMSDVIEEIAFQTNILALNAAIEAARAGDAGKSFEVVAGEVRDLAHRSAGAAREIRRLLDASATEIAGANRLVVGARTAMGKVVGEADTVAGIVDEIARANDEQSAGLSRTNEALQQIDALTAENAAFVAARARVAATVDADAKALKRSVAAFRLGDGVGAEDEETPSISVLVAA